MNITIQIRYPEDIALIDRAMQALRAQTAQADDLAQRLNDQLKDQLEKPGGPVPTMPNGTPRRLPDPAPAAQSAQGLEGMQ